MKSNFEARTVSAGLGLKRSFTGCDLWQTWHSYCNYPTEDTVLDFHDGVIDTIRGMHNDGKRHSLERNRISKSATVLVWSGVAGAKQLISGNVRRTLTGWGMKKTILQETSVTGNLFEESCRNVPALRNVQASEEENEKKVNIFLKML